MYSLRHESELKETVARARVNPLYIAQPESNALYLFLQITTHAFHTARLTFVCLLKELTGKDFKFH